MPSASFQGLRSLATATWRESAEVQAANSVIDRCCWLKQFKFTMSEAAHWGAKAYGLLRFRIPLLAKS
jgi:hypothetical protein